MYVCMYVCLWDDHESSGIDPRDVDDGNGQWGGRKEGEADKQEEQGQEAEEPASSSSSSSDQQQQPEQ